MYYVVSDMKDEAFVCSEEISDILGYYTGYLVIEKFYSRENAEKFCTDYNNNNGKCAYMEE